MTIAEILARWMQAILLAAEWFVHLFVAPPRYAQLALPI